MKKLWLSALTAAVLMTGLSTAARADDWHRGGWHHGHDRWERCDDRRYYGRPYGYYRPYREIREVYYAPAPRYYRPAPVYYGGYGRGYDSGIRGTISVDF